MGIEPQAGIYLNNNSNRFVHMYFGRVAGNNDNDGFLITQFLSEDIEPIITTNKNNHNIRIIPQDAHSGNIRKNIIIDYGDVIVRDKDDSPMPSGIVIASELKNKGQWF